MKCVVESKCFPKSKNTCSLWEKVDLKSENKSIFITAFFVVVSGYRKYLYKYCVKCRKSVCGDGGNDGGSVEERDELTDGLMKMVCSA